MEPLSRIDNGQIKCEEGLFFYSLLVLPVFSSDVTWGYLTIRPPHHMFWRLASWMSTRVRCVKSKSELSGASLSSADINKEMETWLISTACVGALKIPAELSVFGALTPS